MVFLNMITGSYCTSIGSYCMDGNNQWCQLTQGYDIIVLGGQSNMSGWGPSDGIEMDAVPDIFQIGSIGTDNFKIIQAQDPLQTPDRNVGSGHCSSIGMRFARLYKDKYLCAGRKILLVPCSSAASSFCCDGVMISSGHPKDTTIPEQRVRWDIGFYLYENLMRRTRRALACDPNIHTLGVVTPSHTASKNPNNKVVAFLWHQGESDNPFTVYGGLDYNFVSSDAGYAGRLRRLIENFRAIPGCEDSVFICGGLSPRFVGWGCENGVRSSVGSIDDWSTAKPVELVQTNIKTIFPTIRRTGFASSRVPSIPGTDPNSCHIHFNASGYRTMGQRYFEQFESIIME